MTISRSLLKRLRVVFSRALGTTARHAALSVTFQSDTDGLLIGVLGSQVAVTYRHQQSVSFDPFAVSFELFKRCESSRDEPVTLTRQGDEIIAEWSDSGIPQVARFPAAEPVEFPTIPEVVQNNGPDLLTALREAVETSERDSPRYALNCLRLRGRDGQIAATDGHQLLVPDGFSFPWDEELLVPACRLFASAEFSTAASIDVGRSGEWVTLRSGAWSIHLKIETSARFPQIDQHLPQTNTAASTLHLSDADAEFLVNSVARLPASKHPHAPVTVELNGSIAIRAKSDEQSTPTELVLMASRRAGEQVKFCTNRTYLSRAARLGFRDLYLNGQDNPACCRDAHRAYVWAMLEKDQIVPSQPDSVRIASPAPTSAPAVTPTLSRKVSPPMNNVSQPTRRVSPVSHQRSEAPGIIAQAEAVRDSLAQALTQTRELISALKQRKKQNQLVRSTLASLRQLETVDV